MINKAKNLAKNNQLVVGLLSAGIALVALSLYFSVFTTNGKSENEIRIAQVSRETGKAFVLRKGYTEKDPVERRAPLYHLNSVETDETGEALINFDSGYSLRVFNNALITLEKIDEQESFYVVVIVKNGEVRIDNFGREGKLFISKNGDRISASDYNGSLMAKTPAITPTPIDTVSTPIPEDQGLSEDEISTGIQKHRTSFFKCYTQLLQKEPTSKGKVSLSFTIENNGKMSVAEVTASELPNAEFKKCLIDVLRRVEFRSFKGPAISTLFPLKFE
jgi:hypothetical protein